MATPYEELTELPRFAQVAFAARCARRAQILYAITAVSSEQNVKINGAIELAEKIATQKSVDGVPVSLIPMNEGLDRSLHECAENWFNISAKLSVTDTAYAAAICAANAAVLASRGDLKDCSEHAWRAYSVATLAPYILIDYWLDRGCDGGAYEDQQSMQNDLTRDFRLLQRLTKRYKWTNDSRVDSWFFFPYYHFDIQEAFGKFSICDVILKTNFQLMDFFRRNPRSIHSISPRQFEELIAHLFNEFGFEVELTCATRDNGRDVIAIKHGIARVKYLIECKRYSFDNPVGISVVQRLHGVVVAEGATKGIVATTARFTKPALAHLSKHKWILEGRDIEGISEWLRDYDSIRLGRLSGKTAY
jgi:hypothetical protein